MEKFPFATVLLTVKTSNRSFFLFSFSFSSACPKFISPAPTNFEERNDFQWAEPFNRQIEVFTEELQEQAYIPDVRRFDENENENI